MYLCLICNWLNDGNSSLFQQWIIWYFIIQIPRVCIWYYYGCVGAKASRHKKYSSVSFRIPVSYSFKKQTEKISLVIPNNTCIKVLHYFLFYLLNLNPTLFYSILDLLFVVVVLLFFHFFFFAQWRSIRIKIICKILQKIKSVCLRKLVCEYQFGSRIVLISILPTKWPEYKEEIVVGKKIYYTLEKKSSKGTFCCCL